MSAVQREQVVRQAKGCCEYCQSQLAFSSDDFTIGHIVPKSAGGGDSLENLALACQGCHNRKYVAINATDPASGQVVPLYNPRQHFWAEHFRWSEDRSLMIGISPIGRATLVRLELNRLNVVNLRRALFVVGLHPLEF